MQNSIVTITFNQFYFSVKKQIKLSQLVRVTGLMDVFVETSFFLTFFLHSAVELRRWDRPHGDATKL